MKKARALLGPLSLLVATAFGCTVIAEVDRDKIPDEGSAGAPDTSGGSGGSGQPGSGGEGAASEGARSEEAARAARSPAEERAAARLAKVAPPADLRAISEITVPAARPSFAARSARLPTCVEGSLGECTACGQKCEDGTADGCGERECTCGDGPACNGSTPFCTEQGCAACRTDADCGGSESQCVDGVCEACDITGNAGCTDSTKPICNSSHVCEKCSGNCAGDLVCDISGACTGCDDSTDCAATASTPICDETSISGIFPVSRVHQRRRLRERARARAVLQRPMRPLRSA